MHSRDRPRARRPDQTHASVLAVTEFLLLAADVCPELTMLILDVHDCTLPPPARLPTLKHLYFTKQHQHAPHNPSVAPLAAQLTTLHLNGQWDIRDVFGEGSEVAPRLTELRITAGMYGGHLKLLLDKAPALKRLRVTELCSSDTASWSLRDEVWAAEEVYVSEFYGWWCNLPIPAGGTIRLHSEAGRPLVLLAAPNMGLEPAYVQRFPYVEFTTQHAQVWPAPYHPTAASDPQCLRMALEQVRDLRAPNVTVYLCGWPWDDQAIRAQVSEVLPTLEVGGRRLKVGLVLGAVNDEMLGWVMGLGSALDTFQCDSLALVSEQHSGSPWPWAKSLITTVHMGTVWKLPRAKGELFVVHFKTLDFGGVEEAAVPTVNRWQRHIRWLPIPDATMVITVPRFHPQPADTLRQQLAALRAVRFAHRGMESKVVVCVRGRLTAEAVPELSGLPQWTTRLDLTQCTWPAESSAALCAQIPTTYTQRRLPNN